MFRCVMAHNTGKGAVTKNLIDLFGFGGRFLGRIRLDDHDGGSVNLAKLASQYHSGHAACAALHNINRVTPGKSVVEFFIF